MILYVVYSFWYIIHKIYNFKYVNYIEFKELSKIAVREKYFHPSPCTYLWEKSLIDIFIHKNKIEDRINNEPYLILAVVIIIMFTRVNGMMAETVLCISLRNEFPINVNILCLVLIFKNSNILFLIHCMFYWL